jgi:hypothetical protein
MTINSKKNFKVTYMYIKNKNTTLILGLLMMTLKNTQTSTLTQQKDKYFFKCPSFVSQHQILITNYKKRQ